MDARRRAAAKVGTLVARVRLNQGFPKSDQNLPRGCRSSPPVRENGPQSQPVPFLLRQASQPVLPTVVLVERGTPAHHKRYGHGGAQQRMPMRLLACRELAMRELRLESLLRAVL